MYKYCESPDFEILILAYAFDNEAPRLLPLGLFGELDQYEKTHFAEFVDALRDPVITKRAYNAQFERVCLSKWLGKRLDPAQWSCTMVEAAMIGLPFGLDIVSKILKLPETKIAEGKALINYFCKPCKPTKTNGGRTRNLPHHDPDKWVRFQKYGIQDVVTERAVRNKIAFFTPTETERRIYQLDQLINDTGIELDRDFINAAIAIADEHADKLHTAAVELSGLDNPNSAAQLKAWLTDRTGFNVKSLTKEAVNVLHAATDIAEVKDLLALRQEMAKTSVKKYESMREYICADNMLRGIHQYYGANRTGRWAGRGVQPQNMPQNHLPDLEMARKVVKECDAETVDMLYGNVPDTLSQLTRTAFVARKGNRLLTSDFNSIEARVIAWLAGEKWRLDVFNTHGKIYEASASQMFKVPIEQVTKGSPLRQKGKVSELALGYQGGVEALKTMGALRMGLTEEELPEIVSRWRKASPKIVNLWNRLNNAALQAVGDKMNVSLMYGISMFCKNNCLFLRLPSGRCLSYVRPRIGVNRWDGPSIIYEGMNQTTKRWEKQETYGGKLTENLVQAIARDLLAEKMLALNAAGYKIVLHVHDEVVCDMPYGVGSIEDVNKIMGTPVKWAPGLPLKAESFESTFYKKD